MHFEDGNLQRGRNCSLAPAWFLAELLQVGPRTELRNVPSTSSIPMGQRGRHQTKRTLTNGCLLFSSAPTTSPVTSPKAVLQGEVCWLKEDFSPPLLSLYLQDPFPTPCHLVSPNTP